MTPSSAKKRKKLPEKVLPELSDSDSNVPEKKQEEVPTKNYFIGSGEKVVPIRDVFKNRILDIEEFKQDKPEVYKALMYIMGSDAKVMKAQADTVDVKLRLNLDKIKISPENFTLLLENNVKLGAFSKANFGESSEECRIIKAWHDLIEEAQIIDKHQLIKDVNSLLADQWHCNIVGCYLSKYLEAPRHALKVFELLTRSILYNKGAFQKN